MVTNKAWTINKNHWRTVCISLTAFHGLLFLLYMSKLSIKNNDLNTIMS